MIKKTKNKTNKRERIFTGNGTVTRKKNFRGKKKNRTKNIYGHRTHTHTQGKSTH